MTASAAKKAGKRGGPAGMLRAVAPSAFLPGVIEDAIDLGGEGYVLIKVSKDAKLHTAHVRAKQEVTRADLLRLVRRLVGTKRQHEAAAPGAEDNTELLDQLQSDAMTERARLHTAGELLTSGALQEKLQVSRQALSKAVRERRMFWVDGPAGAHWYPSFFANDNVHRRDVEQVSVHLADLPGSVKWQFFTTPKHSLGGRTPIQALENGDVALVLRTAAEFKERNLGR